MTLLSFDKLSLFERIFNFSDFCHELFIYRDLVLDVLAGVQDGGMVAVPYQMTNLGRRDIGMLLG